jgi:hypothetical protein
MLVVIAGLLALFLVLNIQSGTSALLARAGAVSAVVTLGLYGVLQAVDGVALKQVVDAWASAPDAEKAARFATAETVRWLEWAVRSYHDFMLGPTFILLRIVIVSITRVPKLIGYLMALTGPVYFVQGWITGVEGFSANNSGVYLHTSDGLRGASGF